MTLIVCGSYYATLNIQLGVKGVPHKFDSEASLGILLKTRLSEFKRMSTFSAEKVNHQVGFMVIHEKGGLISSGGELEYNEVLADLFYKMVKEGTDKGLLSLSDNEGGFKKLTVQFEDHFYVVAVSNKKIHVVKRKYYPTDPALV
ncbi:hypothetical protein AVEN_106435-1 [Araneus ventricosus]|uniref:Late endosomal/lysosomal adaptor and MAPK and MTOR activator 4 n=1 Tax=Araneus ventricosus TaxID=182803 RepID=A0A4Y2ASH5_ARAVE|nr:hypothetical protein AVEN_106435-1 [Araneus ventricosus]